MRKSCAICRARFNACGVSIYTVPPPCRHEATVRRKRRPGYVKKKAASDARRHLRQRIAAQWFAAHGIDPLGGD
jgi:hypothetical protein